MIQSNISRVAILQRAVARLCLYCLVGSLCLSILACRSPLAPMSAGLTNLDSLVAAPGQSFWVMSYNVENLFDLEDDVGKDDHAFLPIGKKQSPEHKDFCAKIPQRKWREECLYQDWNQENLNFKLEQIGRVLKAVNGGQGPDVVLLVEIENLKVLELLRKGPLKDLGYQTAVLIEGDDERGIDTALLSKFPVIGSKLHKIPFDVEKVSKAAADTRGLLQTDLKLPDGSVMTFISVHLPNPAHPAVLRQQALAYLKSVVERLPKDRSTVVGGDFNVSGEEDARDSVYKNLSPDFLVSQLVADTIYPGTNYFPPKREWSYLDALLFTKNLARDADRSIASKWQLEPATIQTLRVGSFQVDSEGRPVRMVVGKDPRGVSDHLPLIARLRKR